MKNRIVILLLAAHITIFALPGFPQEGRGLGRLVGTVTDEAEKPLADVKILMKSTSYDFQREAVSDSKGKWSFIGFAKDIFAFTFSKDGYETAHAQISLSGANRNPAQKFVLKKISQGLGLGVVVPAELGKSSRAVEAYQAGRYEDALPLLSELVNAHSDAHLARILLADTHLRLKHYPEAIAEYQKAVAALAADGIADQEKAKVSDIYLAMAGAYQEQNLYEESAGCYQKAFELVPPTSSAEPYNLAELLYMADQVDEAIRYYGIAARLNPKEGRYQLKLGYAFLRKQDNASAVKHFEEFLVLRPEDPQADSIRQIIGTLKK